MSRLLDLLELPQVPTTTAGSGPASGPEGKRAFGGQFVAQSLAAACRTVDSDRLPTNMHLQFLRGGQAGDPVDYSVTPVFDGRTSAARRVDARQDDRLLTTSSVSFAVDLPGPEHGHRDGVPGDPDTLPETGPAGPAPSMPLDELDIRIADAITGGEFVRRFWWRATVPIPDDPLIHTLVAAYVTDVYMIDPALVGARAFDEGPYSSQRDDRFVDLVSPTGPRERVEPAGNQVARRRARARRRHRNPGRRGRRYRGDPGAGRAYRRAGTESR